MRKIITFNAHRRLFECEPLRDGPVEFGGVGDGSIKSDC